MGVLAEFSIHTKAVPSPRGLQNQEDAYPALNYPNPRNPGVAWGPRFALGYVMPSPPGGTDTFALGRRSPLGMQE